MNVRRVVPAINCDNPERTRDFYVDLLGLEVNGYGLGRGARLTE